MMQVSIQRVAAIHDLSGFGRASLTVVIPVLSTMGIQVCPLPTAVLSSQTSGVEGFTFHDLTPEMPRMLDHWQSLGLRFDAVYSGFLGNPAQADIVARCMDNFRVPCGLAVIDPVLGDNGLLDPTQTPEMVESMRRLIAKADVITPNFTESAFLLDEAYAPDISQDALKDRLTLLAGLGPARVVITSAPSPNHDIVSTVAFDSRQRCFWRVDTPRIPAFYPGTGDIFTSVLTGAMLQGDSLPAAMARAVQFVARAMHITFSLAMPHRDGVLLECVLAVLREPVLPTRIESF